MTWFLAYSKDHKDVRALHKLHVPPCMLRWMDGQKDSQTDRNRRTHTEAPHKSYSHVHLHTHACCMIQQPHLRLLLSNGVGDDLV